MSAAQIVAAARACLGTPFHHQGRQPGVGIDCAGLVIVAARAAGFDPVDLPGYGRRPHGGALESAIAIQPGLDAAPIDDLADGDVLLMRFKTEPQHLAIYAEGGIIHAYESVGRVVEHRLDESWRARIVSAHRFVGAPA